ncbi:MAG: cation-translocating P-type ATPase [Deltaproteobacteria bacterium]|nr:cation-translocating P-type ATPase [Deltaproteobacteria bacterium]
MFQILSNSPEGPPADFRKTELYRTCLALGVIANPGPENDAGGAESPDPEPERLSQELTLQVEGMWCTACAWIIEHALKKTRGVTQATVSFFADVLQVKYFPHMITPEELQKRVRRLGYRVQPISDKQAEGGMNEGLFVRLCVSAALTANIMMISFALYFGFFQDLEGDSIRYLSLVLLALATPVVFYGGYPIFRRGLGGIRHGIMSMETLISVGVLAAYSCSVAQISMGTLHLYFDTASMLVTVVMIGKFIEGRAKEKIFRGISHLYSLYRTKVRLVQDGRERWVNSEALQVGDIFWVLAGERIPLDGTVLSGKGGADESILTGEVQPVGKSPGDRVVAGAVLLEGKLEVKTSRPAENGTIMEMIRIIRSILAEKSPFEHLADRITRRLVPLVLLLAGAVFCTLWLMGSSSHDSLMRALTVLVITCPCALAVATPLAKIACIQAGKAAGILIRDHQAFETARNLTQVVLDKTGTLTKGEFSLNGIIPVGSSEEEVLRRAASVEIHSDHFLARVILQRASGLPLETVLCYEALPGMGIRGTLTCGDVGVGNRALMGHMGIHIPHFLEEVARGLENRGSTVLFCAWDNGVQGVMHFGDVVRESAISLVQRLKSKGIIVRMASGDSRKTTEALAGTLGIEFWHGELLPLEKKIIVEDLQQQGQCVGFVGDGINDAPALTQADVGFACGTVAQVLHEAGHVNLPSGNPSLVIQSIELSRETCRTIRQNLFFALLYNALAIPLAALGFMNPMVAVFAMFASSLSVIGNTLRLTRRWNTADRY